SGEEEAPDPPRQAQVGSRRRSATQPAAQPRRPTMHPVQPRQVLQPMTARPVPSHDDAITLGILAGGRATRLGGRDKAWLERAGKPLVLALARRLAPEVDATLVSANRNPEHYLSHGLRPIHDRIAGIGPLGGLEALAAACRTPWLLTVPVDVVDVNDCLLRSLRAAGPRGAWAEDDDGPQPLVALWPVETL